MRAAGEILRFSLPFTRQKLAPPAIFCIFHYHTQGKNYRRRRNLRFHGHTQGENSAADVILRNVMLSVGGETMKILCFGRTFF